HWFLRQMIVSNLIFLTIPGCGRSKEESHPQASRQAVSPNPSGGLPGQSESPTLASVSTQHATSEAAVPSASSHGTVMIGGEFELTVTGKGAGDLSRAPKVLEQQLHTFLPQLREIYDQQLAHDPNGMGSLDVRMTIEPNGTISALRFPVKRMSSEKLTVALYDVMRAWQFLPAEYAVDLRYRMILIPAGMDPTSISTWEKTLADRDEIDRSEKISPIVASASVASGERSPSPSAPATTKEHSERMNPERSHANPQIGETPIG